jgi:ABC-2 type transport system permease protein
VAVHRRAYRPYDGPLTPERWRFLVLPRYALMELFESRTLSVFLVLCLVPFLVEALAVYVVNSPAARTLLQVSGSPDPVRAEFFLAALGVQGVLAFLLTAWVAPVLVSPDLVNGALPLLLSRPFSRAEYVLGKAATLALLLSAVTWVPGLLLFSLQAGLAQGEWLLANLRLPWAIFASGAIWIAVLTLLGLAVSSWVRWRLVASASIAGVFFMGTAFGEMWREVLRDPWGRLANLTYLVGIVWRDLFEVALRRPLVREWFDDRRGADLPAWAAWLGLLAACSLFLLILDRRLRAREVV